MIEAIALSHLPLRADGLALLLAHRHKQRQREEAKQLYLGNIQYSILGSLHALGKSELKMPSFGAFLAALDGEKAENPQKESAEVLQTAVDNIRMFLPK